MTLNVRRSIMVAMLPLTLLLTGCSLGSLFGQKSEPPPTPAGVYKSTDRGETWTTKNTVVNTTPPSLASMNATNIVTLMFDPTDRASVYAGSDKQGLYYTYNEAESWLPAGVTTVPIYDIAVPNSPTLRCTIYIADGNKVHKSIDCGRHWEEMFRDPRGGLVVYTVAVHRTSHGTVLVGLSTGEIVRSTDGGISWQTVGRFKNPIRKIIAHPQNDKVFYGVVKDTGMIKSTDAGVTWNDLSEGVKTFSGGQRIRDIAIDALNGENLLVASDYGLLRSANGGTTWEALPLITPPGKAKISAVAINPTVSADIYYTTDATLYRSKDGGKTWDPKPLPISNAVTSLLVDPKKPETLYLGVYYGKAGAGPLGL